MGKDLILSRVFGGRPDDRDHAIRIFNEYEDEVKATVPPDRLLVFSAGDGWEPLCAFLGVPVPDTPYPRSNSREEFLGRFRPGQ